LGSEEVNIIIFLDKDPARAALQFQRMNLFDQNRTIWIQSAKEAISIIREYRGKIDIVSLGYDLTDLEYNHPARADNGLEVVRVLEKEDTKLYKDVRFIVHSWNTQQGNKMSRRLAAAGFRVLNRPFGS
tara:strand:+ start:398 stop:784 length:387 start_codon:yes stop_codon:yes gene_type:complete